MADKNTEWMTWKDYTPAPTSNDIDRIVSFPDSVFDDIEKVKPGDIALWLAGTNFKDDEACKNMVVLIELCIKYRDRRHLSFCLWRLAGRLGINALALTSRLQIGAKILTPTVTRDQLGLKKGKNEQEEVYRGSDMNEKNKHEKPPEA